jgi:hypothetical protein
VVSKLLTQLPSLFLIHLSEAAAGNNANSEMKVLMLSDYEIIYHIANARLINVMRVSVSDRANRSNRMDFQNFWPMGYVLVNH